MYHRPDQLMGCGGLRYGGGANGLVLFIRAIPYNYYALLTLLMIIVISILNIDFG